MYNSKLQICQRLFSEVFYCFLANRNRDIFRPRMKSGNFEREREEIEAISRDMINLARELEATTTKTETSL